MILYGLTPSPFTRKCIMMLEEKNLSYQFRRMPAYPKSDFLLRNHPMGKIPFLEDAGTTVPDSSVICAYLEKKYPQNPLYPQEAGDLAKALFLEEFADTKIVSVVGKVLFEIMAKSMIHPGQKSDMRLIDKLLNEDLPPILDYLEKQMPAQGDHILDSFSIADIAIGAHLMSMQIFDEEIDNIKWPRTHAYLEALESRQSAQKSLSISPEGDW